MLRDSPEMLRADARGQLGDSEERNVGHWKAFRGPARTQHCGETCGLHFGGLRSDRVRRMASFGILRRVALVRDKVWEEFGISIIRVTRICELGTLATISNRRTLRRLLIVANVPSSQILVTLMMEVLSSSETSVLTRATWPNIPEDAILNSHRCENLRSYIALTGWTL
jgi:hypothetical protein